MGEIFEIDFNNPFIPDDSYIRERSRCIKPYSDIWSVIHRGAMPELLDPDRDWEWFYRDYVRTYLERDIRRIINMMLGSKGSQLTSGNINGNIGILGGKQ